MWRPAENACNIHSTVECNNHTIPPPQQVMLGVASFSSMSCCNNPHCTSILWRTSACLEVLLCGTVCMGRCCNEGFVEISDASRLLKCVLLPIHKTTMTPTCTLTMHVCIPGHTSHACALVVVNNEVIHRKRIAAPHLFTMTSLYVYFSNIARPRPATPTLP
jgi:hypothetical protein